MKDIVEFFESVLGQDYDVKDYDLILNEIHKYCDGIESAGGCRHGRTKDAAEYDKWAENFVKLLYKMFKKCSSAKAKSDYANQAFIIAKSPQISQFHRGHYNFIIHPTGVIDGTRNYFGAQILTCPLFQFMADPKQDLSAKGTSGVTPFPIPNELAQEICKILVAELPK